MLDRIEEDRNRQIEEILRRPYHRVLVPDEDTGVYGASIQEFDGCFAEGETAQEAYESLHRSARAWLESLIAQGMSVPEPIEEEEYSGRIALRLPRSLHRRAVNQAEREGVSLNTFLVMAISERVAVASTAVPAVTTSLEATTARFFSVFLFQRPDWGVATPTLPSLFARGEGFVGGELRVPALSSGRGM